MVSRNILSRATVLLFLVYSAFAEIAKESGVLVLTDDNFDEAIDLHPDGLLVEMYAPWCGHCKKLTPQYEAAAKELEKSGFSIAKLDATVHKVVAAKYGVKGFPTIKYIGKDKTIDYTGGRTSADIISYVIKKSGPVTVALGSKEAVENFVAKADVTVVAFVSNAKSSAFEAFTGAASAMDDLLFGVVSDSSIMSEYDVSDNTVILFKNFDELKAVKDISTSTLEEIVEFVSFSSIRLLTTFSPETSKSIFGGPVKVHALFFAEKLEKELETDVMFSAKENKGKLLHVFVPSKETKVMEYFGLKAEDLPTMLIADMNQNLKKFPIGHKDLNQESIAAFESEFLDGKLLPTLKSEEISTDDLAEHVKVVKGKSFESIVLDNEKDVLVEFYAPWCGHCKSLAPKYDELAEKLSGIESVVIAKMDNTANEIDIPGVEVKGYPTLYFFPGKNKSTPKLFSGKREVDDLLAFIVKEASTSFDLDAGEKITADTAKDEL
jgi:protein disulfide-isomerase A1